MKESRFSALCLIAALSLLASIHGVSGQVISPSAQNVASRPVASRSAPAARPIANTSIAPRVAPAPANFRPQAFNRYAPRTIGQPATTNRARLRHDSRAGEFADQAVHRNATNDAGHVQRRPWRIRRQDDAADGRDFRNGER